MAEVISMGKRTLEYNPISDLIAREHPDDMIMLETMFTWEVDPAIAKKRQMATITTKEIIIDGPGWRNAGHQGHFDISEIDYHSHVPDDQEVQVTKITEGCPNNCQFCFSKDFRVIGMPVFKRNHVKLTDENLLAHPGIEGILKELSQVRVNGKVVYYEAICGLEKARITPEIAPLLKEARFKNIRIAWDEPFTDASQKRAQKAVRTLVKAGYNKKTISIFILTNWKVTQAECEQKLDLMKVWNVKVNDCCFNCCYDNPIPDGWTLQEIKDFRRKCRKHNQIVNFEIDPEMKDVAPRGQHS